MNFPLFQGHAAPILYAAVAETGLFPTEDLMKLRKIDNDLEGHPTPVSNFSFISSVKQDLLKYFMEYSGLTSESKIEPYHPLFRYRFLKI